MPKGNPIAEDRMTVLQNELKQVGIEMQIELLEWAAFTDKLKQRDSDVITLGWQMALENDPYQIWHGSGAGKNNRGSNHVSFNHPVADELIEMLRVTVDPKKREQIHKSFHRLIDREQPYMFLYCAKDLGAYHQRFPKTGGGHL